MQTVISEFRGKYNWASNFCTDHPFVYRGRKVRSSEHAYQASKTLDKEYREKILRTKYPADVKKLGSDKKIVKKRPDWNDVKVEVMYKILKAKFSVPEYRKLLLATNDALLMEGNWWHDRFWGVCTCKVCNNTGKNMLGKLLVKIRKELQSESES